MKRPLTTATTHNQVAIQPSTPLTDGPAAPPLDPLHLLIPIGLAVGLGIAKGLTQSFSGQNNSSNLVSRVDYERIQPGMTQVQVEATLPPGVEVSRSKESNRLVWENPDGSKIEANFQDGILTHKAQSGLK